MCFYLEILSLQFAGLNPAKITMLNKVHLGNYTVLLTETFFLKAFILQ